ncbi:MAG: hypothetical protein H0T89_20210 [Deltaproteobacteria bacterium]|nr:hypothetical protein [Deltaproteobacteria bacterium]
MRVAFGTVLDRAWGTTLGVVGQRKLSGQLDLRADDGKTYAIAFTDGVVVAATSPLASDSIARIALTSHLVSSSQIGEITRRLAAAPERDEVEVLAETTRLGVEHVAILRRKLTIARAARTFSVDRGEFEIVDEVGIPVRPDCSVPLGAVMFHGVRMNLSEQRLAEDLLELGTSYRLREISDDDLDGFQFGTDSGLIIDELREGTTLAALEANHRDVEPRTMKAMVYALVTCGACEAVGGKPVDRAAAHPPPPPLSRTITPTSRTVTEATLVSRTSTVRGNFASRPAVEMPRRSTVDLPRRPAVETHRAADITTPPTGISIKRSNAPTMMGQQANQAPHTSRTITAPRTITSRDRAAREIEALIATRIAMIERNADHFAVLGIVPEAPVEAVRAAYFSMARKLHADSLKEVGIVDEAGHGPRVLAQLNAAFMVLSDATRRRDYVSALKRGELTAVAPRARTGELDKSELAMEAFQRGELALRREQISEAVDELGKAARLAPQNLDYAALLAWARFCASEDKQSISGETRRALLRAIDRSSNPLNWHFLLGRIERILGRTREALAHFQEVLDVNPAHQEAAAEVRVLLTRTKESTESKGLFGRKR